MVDYSKWKDIEVRNLGNAFVYAVGSALFWKPTLKKKNTLVGVKFSIDLIEYIWKFVVFHLQISDDEDDVSTKW